MPIIVGDVITVSTDITDRAGAASDPPKLKLHYKDGAGGPAAGVKGTLANPYIYGTDAEIVKDSTGHYHIDLPITVAGKWQYRWASYGATDIVRGADQGEFNVEASNFV